MKHKFKDGLITLALFGEIVIVVVVVNEFYFTLS